MVTCKIESLWELKYERGYLMPLHISEDLVALGDFLSIGRAGSNQLILQDPFVSQRHARIEKRGDQFILKDLRSSNGTLLNETPVVEAVLKTNDRLRFGETQFVFSSVKNNGNNEQLKSLNVDWQKQLQRIPAFAATQHTVLIIGASGTGKELIAKQIHDLSPRKNSPYITINCSALSEQLIESELFGHVKGSFTGAVECRKGAFETGRGGTLFLDEIGDLPLNLQPKLLRALENQEIRPVGSDKTIRTDVRILAATHKNLYEKVLKKEFREDLFHRLNVCRVSPPSLLDRMEDFETLLYTMAKDLRVRFSFNSIEKLKDHSWPGNIRELKNLISRASAYYPGETIQETHILELLDQDPQNSVALENLPPLREIEREMILKNLEKHYGNQRRAAEDLKMPKSTLNDKLRHYGINPKLFKKRSKI